MPAVRLRKTEGYGYGIQGHYRGPAGPPGRSPRATRSTRARAARAGKKKYCRTRGLPSAGNYGRNVIAQAVSDRAERMPFRRNASAVRGLEMSSTTPHNIMRRVGVCPGGGRRARLRHRCAAPPWCTPTRRPSASTAQRCGSGYFSIPRPAIPCSLSGPVGGADVPREALGEGWDGDPRMRRMDVVQEIPRAAVLGPHNPGDAPRRGEMRMQEMQRGARNAAQDIRRRVQYRVVAHVRRPARRGAPQAAQTYPRNDAQVRQPPRGREIHGASSEGRCPTCSGSSWIRQYPPPITRRSAACGR